MKTVTSTGWPDYAVSLRIHPSYREEGAVRKSFFVPDQLMRSGTNPPDMLAARLAPSKTGGSGKRGCDNLRTFSARGEHFDEQTKPGVFKLVKANLRDPVFVLCRTSWQGLSRFGVRWPDAAFVLRQPCVLHDSCWRS